MSLLWARLWSLEVDGRAILKGSKVGEVEGLVVRAAMSLLEKSISRGVGWSIGGAPSLPVIELLAGIGARFMFDARHRWPFCGRGHLLSTFSHPERPTPSMRANEVDSSRSLIFNIIL